VQATGRGQTQITIRATTIPATRMVELRVEDNGPGVSQDQAEKIFEPYFTTKTEGTGLGLAIVKKIIEEHGGIIWAENTKPGARIQARLPTGPSSSEGSPPT